MSNEDIMRMIFAKSEKAEELLSTLRNHADEHQYTGVRFTCLELGEVIEEIEKLVEVIE